MKNGHIWKDTNGNDIQAHGGCIIKVEDIYYWYGEHKGQDNRPGLFEVDVIGVSCYSSFDLMNWKYEGLVLESNKENEESFIHFSKILERPKVVYNKKNNNFVMLFHCESANRKLAAVGFAVCDTPNGKFEFLTAIRPQGLDARDMTVYVDGDKRAYVFHSSHGNRTMVVSLLNDDYTDFTGEYKEILIDQEREAPAIFKYDNMYYMISSGCSGWYPNACLYAECKSILGRWKLIDNACVGENSHITFGGQSSYVFKANNKFYLMLDHWCPENLKDSAYSILPVNFRENRTIEIKWQDDWNGITE